MHKFNVRRTQSYDPHSGLKPSKWWQRRSTTLTLDTSKGFVAWSAIDPSQLRLGCKLKHPASHFTPTFQVACRHGRVEDCFSSSAHEGVPNSFDWVDSPTLLLPAPGQKVVFSVAFGEQWFEFRLRNHRPTLCEDLAAVGTVQTLPPPRKHS